LHQYGTGNAESSPSGLGNGHAVSLRKRFNGPWKKEVDMNKTFALLAAFALMFAVAGCPNKEGDKPSAPAQTEAEKKAAEEKAAKEKADKEAAEKAAKPAG